MCRFFTPSYIIYYSRCVFGVDCQLLTLTLIPAFTTAINPAIGVRAGRGTRHPAIGVRGAGRCQITTDKW